MEKILDIFLTGGPMMVPLAALAFAGSLIFVERLLYLHKGQIRAREFVSGIKTALKNRRMLEALTICDESYGPIPRIVKTALLNSEQPRDVMSQSVAVASQNEFALIERRVASVALIAKIAPLLGLMGTVIALLQIFYTMSHSGSYATVSQFTAYVYAALLSKCRRAYVTRVDDAAADADAFFPNLDKLPGWETESVSDPVTENGVTYRFIDYVNTKI